MKAGWTNCPDWIADGKSAGIYVSSVLVLVQASVCSVLVLMQVYVSSVLVLMQVKLLLSLFSCRYMLVLSFSRVACKSHSGGMSICRESGYTADGQLLWLPSSS